MLDPLERFIFNLVALLTIFLVLFSIYRQVDFIIDLTKTKGMLQAWGQWRGLVDKCLGKIFK